MCYRIPNKSNYFSVKLNLANGQCNMQDILSGYRQSLFWSFYITRNGLNRTVASFDNKLELAQITLGLSNDTQSGQTQLQCMEGISNVSIKE